MSSAQLGSIVKQMREMGETQLLLECDGSPVLIELRPAPAVIDITITESSDQGFSALITANDQAVAALWNTCIRQNHLAN